MSVPTSKDDDDRNYTERNSLFSPNFCNDTNNFVIKLMKMTEYILICNNRKIIFEDNKD